MRRHPARRAWTGTAVTLAVLIGGGILGGTVGTGTADATTSRSGTVVRRTGHGIPHILARDHHGLGLGAGYASAEDNLCLVADTVLTLSGERSRWFGADARTIDGVTNLNSDLYHESLKGTVERLLARPYPAGPSRAARDLVRGYVEGYNRHLAETTVDGLPDPTCRGAGWVRPLTELDIWRRVHGFATGGADDLQNAVVEAQPPGSTVPTSDPGALPDASAEIGSNAYALGRQATGGAGMLLANPHLPWHGAWRLYQMQFTIPGELNVSGAGLMGMPVIGIGHNDRVAWTHTSSTAQTRTLARLTLTPGDPLGYVVDGRPHRMLAQPVTVTVRGADGTLTPVTRTLYRTPDGPLVTDGPLRWTGSNAYVLRDANATNLRVIDQWLAMARARTVGDVHAALARLHGVPSYNTLAADSTGAAYYSTVQVVPHVTDGLLARCSANQAGGPIVLDGSRSGCGWGSDPGTVVPGLLGPARLPTLTRADHVSNMNDSPWLANPAAPLTGYPAILGTVGTRRSVRTRLGLDMIADRLDGSDGLGPPGFSLATLQATMLGNRVLSAEEGRASTVDLCRARPTLTAGDGQPVDVRAACDALAGWSGRADVDARGAVLWGAFVSRLTDSRVDASTVPFDPADPARTPRGFDATRPGVAAALADAVQMLDRAGIPVDVKLGDAQRHAGVPVAGCRGSDGCFNVANTDRRPDQAVGGIRHGSTFIMAVELTPAGPRARTILTYGQSADPTSAYFTDQTRLYAAGQWVTGRFTEAEIARDPALTVHRLAR